MPRVRSHGKRNRQASATFQRSPSLRGGCLHYHSSVSSAATSKSSGQLSSPTRKSSRDVLEPSATGASRLSEVKGWCLTRRPSRRAAAYSRAVEKSTALDDLLG